MVFSQGSSSSFALDYARQYNITRTDSTPYTFPEDAFVYGRLEYDGGDELDIVINNARPVMISVDSYTSTGTGNHYSSRTTYWYAMFAFVRKGDVIRFRNNYHHTREYAGNFTIIPVRK